MGKFLDTVEEIGILQRAVDRRNKAIDEYWKPYVERVKAELAYCEALLLDCQKAHDVTIKERDELRADLAELKEVANDADGRRLDA